MKIALLTLLCVIASNEPDFVSQQKKYPRVRNAYHEKEALLTRRLKEHNLSLDNLNILIMAYKTECVMDIYAKKREDKVYKKVTTYKICARSGSLGQNVVKETYKSRKASTISTTLIPRVTIISL